MVLRSSRNVVVMSGSCAFKYFSSVILLSDSVIIYTCLLYSSDAADEEESVDSGNR